MIYPFIQRLLKLKAKRALLLFVLALLVFGCGDEENSPSQCGQTALTINGTRYETSSPSAAFMERGKRLRLDLLSLVGNDTLYLAMFMENWHLIGSSPEAAFVTTFKKNPEYLNCKTSEKSFENCGVQAGHGAIINEAYAYMMLEDDPDGRIRVFSFNRSKKKVSGDFSFKAVKMDKNGLGDTIRVAGSFEEVCFIPYQ